MILFILLYYKVKPLQHTTSRELGMNLTRCEHGFKYLMVDRDGLMVEKSQAGVLYADDVCLIASNEQDLQRIVDIIS